MASRTTIRRRYYLEIMERDGFIICGICTFPITREKLLTVDHIIPKSKGGTDHDYNFQPAHWICNHKKDSSFQSATDDIEYIIPKQRNPRLKGRWGNKRDYHHRLEMKRKRDRRAK